MVQIEFDQRIWHYGSVDGVCKCALPVISRITQMAPSTKPRGEVAELQVSLQGLLTLGKRTPKELGNAKKDVFRKIVSLVSVGMDMR